MERKKWSHSRILVGDNSLKESCMNSLVLCTWEIKKRYVMVKRLKNQNRRG